MRGRGRGMVRGNMMSRGVIRETGRVRVGRGGGEEIVSVCDIRRKNSM